MSLFDHLDWPELRRRAKTNPWYAEILAAVRDRVEAELEYGLEVPDKPGGWLHHYVCPETWLPLVYDAGEPSAHAAPSGTVYRGERYDAAWRVWRHRQLADLARDAAILYRLTDAPGYRDAALTILLAYAERYATYAGDEAAEAWMLKGRAFNQALTEALWAVPLVHAFAIAGHDVLAAQAQKVRRELLEPIAATLSRAHDALLTQGRLKSNYTAWLLAALGSIGFATGDAELIKRVTDGPGGFKAHLAEAIHADGLEYEGTPYYHNFVALAYGLLAAAAAGNGTDLYKVKGPSGQSIAQLWDALASLAYPDGTLPEANDGSYWPKSIYDAELCDVYELALARTARDDYAWLLKQAYARRGTGRDRWTALLYARQEVISTPPSPPAITHLPQSGVVILRQAHDLAAYIPYGPYAGSHSHFDRLSLNLWPFSRDAGSPPYAAEARLEWYQQTLAHNAVTVDGRSQEKGGARLLHLGDSSADFLATDLYPGVELRRRLELSPKRLSDKTSLVAEAPHTYDWLCHTDSTWQLERVALSTADEPLTAAGPGAFVQIEARATCSGSLIATTASQGKVYRLQLEVDSPFELLLGRCPGRSQQPHLPRHVLIARTIGPAAQYRAHYEVA